MSSLGPCTTADIPALLGGILGLSRGRSGDLEVTVARHDSPSQLPSIPRDATSAATTVSAARRGLMVYLVVVLVLSTAVEAAIIVTQQFASLVLVLMWMPALASLAVRLARREGFADVSFRFGGRRTLCGLVAALLLPLAVGLVAYGTAWLTGLVTFAPVSTALTPALASPLERFAVLLGLALTTGLVVNTVAAAGEEIGWRGYMLPRLIGGHIRYPILTSGIIWGLWHVPLIVAGLYAAGPTPLLSVPIFLVGVISIAVLIARARLATGSIWPAIVLHGAWNAIIQGAFDRSTTGPGALLWTGESGILVAATLATFALASMRLRLPTLMTVPPRAAPSGTEPAQAPA
jgi:uncharacterized protein